MDLYNYVRPRDFKDLFPTSKCITVFPAQIKAYLGGDKSAISQNMIFHSNLPGLGKTTVGRIFACELNRELLTDSEVEDLFEGRANPVFIEVNAGNFRRIEDARQYAAEIEFKREAAWGYHYVYMFNEAHKMTPDAQDLFLDLSENLPEHIHIIFTTTSLETMNDKLRSRLQKHFFEPLTKAQVEMLLKDICKTLEKPEPPQDILDEIFAQEGGSGRGAITALSSFLMTGALSGPDKDITEEASKALGKMMHALEALAMGERGITWSTVQYQLRILLRNCPIAEIRSSILKDLSSRLMSPDFMKGSSAEKIMNKASLAERIGEIFSAPIGYPPGADVIIKTFQSYMIATRLGRAKVSPPGGATPS